MDGIISDIPQLRPLLLKLNSLELYVERSHKLTCWGMRMVVILSAVQMPIFHLIAIKCVLLRFIVLLVLDRAESGPHRMMHLPCGACVSGIVVKDIINSYFLVRV